MYIFHLKIDEADTADKADKEAVQTTWTSAVDCLKVGANGKESSAKFVLCILLRPCECIKSDKSEKL